MEDQAKGEAEGQAEAHTDDVTGNNADDYSPTTNHF